VVDLMNLENQVDLDFTRARRRARLGRLKTLCLGALPEAPSSLPRSSGAPSRPAGFCTGV
jgi:hypothetical protein